MRRGSKGVILLGLFFLVVGFSWTSLIYIRCSKLAALRRGPVLQVLQENIKDSARTIKEIINPPKRTFYAKPYQIRLFWGIILLELIAASYYIFSGIALIRLYPVGILMSRVCLSADFFFKIYVLGYMQFCAIPLQQLTHKKNLLFSYYVPDQSWVSQAFAVLTGLRIYQHGWWIFLVTYTAYLVLCFYFLSRIKDTKTSRQTSSGLPSAA